MKPLKVNLGSNTSFVGVKMRNYSSLHSLFKKNIVADLLSCKRVYQNRTSLSAYTPVIVSKGARQVSVKMDLRSVNKLTLNDNFMMPNVNQELHSISGSNVYANFDLSYGYWQLTLHTDSQ